MAGEGLPGFDEMEVIIIGAQGVDGAEVVILDGALGVDQRSFKADEAGLTPLNGGELVDEALLGVVAGFVGGSSFGDVLFEGGDVFDAEDDVDDGGESVFDGVRAGFGFSFGGDWAVGLSSVDARLLGAGEFFGHG